MRLVDTHTHLFAEEFDGDRDEAVVRAVGAGVDTLMCPAIDSATHVAMLELCARYPANCFPMMGLHPTSVNDNPHWREELAEVERYLLESAVGEMSIGTNIKKPLTFYAVGEVGLDFYWSREWRVEQEEAFVRQIELSLQYSLPLVIHTRDAWPEMIAVLRGFAGRPLRGVMHAFGGTLEEYLAVKECGDFLFGIGGPVTYKKSTLPEVVADMRLSDIVLETDSPYLPPVPFRGKRNESSYLTHICEKVAAIKGFLPEEVAASTTANAVRMFHIRC